MAMEPDRHEHALIGGDMRAGIVRPAIDSPTRRPDPIDPDDDLHHS